MTSLLSNLPSDPWFYVVGFIAVIITGISKGGFGGIALLSVPILSLVVSPITAAAIMLPLLLIMDGIGIFAWRSNADWRNLSMLLPGAFIGILVGAATAQFVDPDDVRLMVGVIAVSFCLYSWWPKKVFSNQPPAPSPAGVFWGSIAGYTSYIAHAGSPPYHTYLLPKKLDKATFAATGVWFFALVNATKLPAYIYTGQLTLEVLITTALFVPVVPVGFFLGVWLNKRVSHILFYRLIYGAVFLTGIKLIYGAMTSSLSS
ncbi:sulfite exporter TauE/SafE family protein [Kiloniella sp.]|uniref:sulfite exporter TauE/SafE family protein n=1 Tax=Kiloniella sp. TaxID=1938587 RepID=UPI003B013E5F